MEEGIFPHSRSLLDEAEVEEERRLCYVGMTRARRRLFLSYALVRTLYGNTQYQVVSRFIQEIPTVLLSGMEKTDTGPTASAESSFGSRRPYGVAAATSPQEQRTGTVTYRPGEKVVHRKWGQGTIITVEGEGQESRIRVAFPGLGIKELLVDLAPLEKVQ
jgi:DNA helicase-2/ATP-dependent DNA helicase PcrA